MLSLKFFAEECYNAVVREISKSYIEDRPAHTSEIIRDWKCCAAEHFDELSVEEVDRKFDELYKQVEQEHLHEALAYA